MTTKDFARASRERCKPDECTGHAECWVLIGVPGAFRGQQNYTRCAACQGRIRTENWITPTELAKQEPGNAV